MTVEANANTLNKKTDSRNLANKLVKRRESKLVKKPSKGKARMDGKNYLR